MTRYLSLFLFLLAFSPRSALPTPSPEAGKRIVLMIGEDEYKTWETLPEFARSELEPRGYRCLIIMSDEQDRNNFPGLESALAQGDLLIVSTRRRTPRIGQLDAVRGFLQRGKPLVGIRTACHAFARRSNETAALDPSLGEWAGFDPEVLGGHYTGHHGAGPKTLISVPSETRQHPILEKLQIGKLEGNGSLYQVSPLSKATTVLLRGEVAGKPPEPVAWTHLYGPKKARIFYTSLGHPDDFKNPEFRRLLRNAVAWALDRESAADPALPPRQGTPR